MPKIELHAHLSGSIRAKTICELLHDDKDKEEFSRLYSLKKLSLDDCFNIFKYIYKINTSLEVIKRIAREMLEDWSKDNCVYIEIRTNIKSINKSTKMDYLEVLLTEIDNFNKSYNLKSIKLIKDFNTSSNNCNNNNNNESNNNYPNYNNLENYNYKNKNNMQARLIISFNRNHSLSEIQDTYETYKQFVNKNKKLSQLIVGLDYSGLEGKELYSQEDLIKILKHARENYNLKSTIHIGEISNYIKWNYDAYIPDRFGHTDYFNEEDAQKLIDYNIPYECCPSSSLSRLNLKSYKEVNLNKYYGKYNKNGEYIKYSINTDDTSLFKNSLSQEYYEIAAAFGISEENIIKIAKRVTDDIFDSNYKIELKDIMNKY